MSVSQLRGSLSLASDLNNRVERVLRAAHVVTATVWLAFLAPALVWPAQCAAAQLIDRHSNQRAAFYRSEIESPTPQSIHLQLDGQMAAYADGADVVFECPDVLLQQDLDDSPAGRPARAVRAPYSAGVLDLTSAAGPPICCQASVV